jgi:type II secretory pathway component PulF
MVITLAFFVVQPMKTGQRNSSVCQPSVVRGRQSRGEVEEHDHVPGVKLAVMSSGEDHGHGHGHMVMLSGSSSGGRRDVILSLVAWCDDACIVVVAATVVVVVMSHHCGHVV